MYATESELADAIESAAEQAITELFSRFSDHHFYYLSLYTYGSAAPEYFRLVGEVLDEAVRGATDLADARSAFRWSYADSPFVGFGEQYFADVNRLFYERRPNIHALHDREHRDEYETRLAAMEQAIARLDSKGLFGVGKERARILVNVEVQEPDWTNTLRAKRLNPPDSAILQEWLRDEAEIPLTDEEVAARAEAERMALFKEQMSQALEGAREAFRRQDYSNVIDLLLPYETLLDKITHAKLAYARQRACKSSANEPYRR